MGDGPKTFDEFKVDLNQLHSAIGSVRREHTAISDAMSAVGREFAAVKDAWGTPSTASFDDVQAWFTRVSGDLEDLLNDMSNRLQTAYNNYKHSEETNVKNLHPHGDNPPPPHKKPGADRHVVTNHDDKPRATARLKETVARDHAAATLREATRRLDPTTPAVPLKDATATIPPNSA